MPPLPWPTRSLWSPVRKKRIQSHVPATVVHALGRHLSSVAARAARTRLPGSASHEVRHRAVVRRAQPRKKSGRGDPRLNLWCEVEECTWPSVPLSVAWPIEKLKSCFASLPVITVLECNGHWILGEHAAPKLSCHLRPACVCVHVLLDLFALQQKACAFIMSSTLAIVLFLFFFFC